MKLQLIVIKGADEGKRFELNAPLFSIGRDPSNQVRLLDTEISRRHAEVYQDPDDPTRYRVRDIGSANGTFVNNAAIRDVPLNPGDQIHIGQSVLVLSGGRADAPLGDLADRISLITRQDVELSSAIIKTVAESEGSRVLSRPAEAGGEWLKSALVSLGVMYELTQAVSHILDLGQLFDRVLELTFRSMAADRGCILLRHPESGNFQPKAVRWRQPDTAQEKLPVSRTIMEHVLHEKQGILVNDALSDERFSSTQSLVRHGVREVICVPMKGRHETLGVIYLDTHSSPRELLDLNPTAGVLQGKFTEDHLTLAIAIAHQAALAVEETRYKEALVQAERLAAVGQTIAALSHHIKNILQGLRSGGDILKMALAEETLDRALLQQGWKIVEKNQNKIYDLVMDMLSFSKEREPAIEEIDVNDVVKDVLELLQGKAQATAVRLDTKLGDLPNCQADPEGLHRALLNVVSNAIDAVEERKSPQVAVVTLLEAGKAGQGDWVRIHVLDNGIGIAADKLGDLFKPFVSSKGARGTGLGLAVSRKILREHGGDILVQSQVGKGSRFVLRLPVRSPLAPDPGTTIPDSMRD